MDLLSALILGAVEGITEYLPVSSTGHLLVTQRLLGIPADEPANAYAVLIQIGAILAVLGVYRRRIGRLWLGLLGRAPDGRRLLWALLCAFLPVAVLGLLLDDWIERHLFGLVTIIAAWVGGAIVLLVVRRWCRDTGKALEELDLRTALIVGCAQCLALWPGVSRSLATLLGALWAGMSLGAAVEFSFLLGLVTLSAATAYKLLDSGPIVLAAYGPAPCLVGVLTAAVAGAIAVRWMVAWLQHRSLSIFAWWRLAAAAVVAILMLNRAL